MSVGGVLETRRLGGGDGDDWVDLSAVVVDLDDEGMGGTFWDDFARVNASIVDVRIRMRFDLRVLGSES